MKNLFRSILSIVLIFSAGSVAADAMVWEVSKGKEKMYIGGTIHMLKASDHPLPVEYAKAYELSDIVVTEVDMLAMQSPQVQQQVMAKSMLPAGQSLQTILDKPTYERLSNTMAEKGMSIAMFNTFKPSMVMLTLTVLEFQKLGFSQKHGVEMTYNTKAKKDKKSEIALETVDEQLNLLLNMADGNESSLVNYNLDELADIAALFDKAVKAWRNGDADALFKILADDLKQKYPKLYDSLLTQRNKNWMPRLEGFLNTRPDELILVGALHLAGPGNVLSLLKEKGYKVKKLSFANTNGASN